MSPKRPGTIEISRGTLAVAVTALSILTTIGSAWANYALLSARVAQGEQERVELRSRIAQVEAAQSAAKLDTALRISHLEDQAQETQKMLERIDGRLSGTAFESAKGRGR